jgi:transcriptional regulator with XRE-family HTH domain
VSRTRKSDEEIEEAMLLGKALAALRVSRGMTQRQVAELAGFTPQRICKAERGNFYPRHSHLKRILGGMGVTFAALHRAQDLVLDPMGEDSEPIDAPDFTPEEAHQAALRLAQEAGKAVAHCCLAFMEMTGQGWRQPRTGGNGAARAQAGPLAARERREVAPLRQDRPDA